MRGSRIHIILVAYVLLFLNNINGQTIDLYNNIEYDSLKLQHLLGKFRPESSFTLRPIYLQADDSIANQKESSLLRLRPIQLLSEYNSTRPYGKNNGNLIRSKGLQAMVTAGIDFKWKFIRIELQPTIMHASNEEFSSFVNEHELQPLNVMYRRVFNRIDLPERFGSSTYSSIDWGESGFFIDYRALSLGVSTQSVWWGPSIRNAPVLSNNARSFAKAEFKSRVPINTKIGTFGFHVFGGKLDDSGFDPALEGNPPRYEDRIDDWRYLSGLYITYSPKFLDGLHLGFTRTSQVYSQDINDFGDIFPFLGSIFKGNDIVGITNQRRDELASLFFKWNWYREKLAFYAEIGKSDHSISFRDFFISPNHAMSYTFGLSKAFELQNGHLLFEAEFSDLSRTGTSMLRSEIPMYTHGYIRHGYTNNGEVLGAGIGPGSTSQFLSLSYYKSDLLFSLFFERIVQMRDVPIIGYNDFEFDTGRAQGIIQETINRNWVDLSLGLKSNIEFTDKINLSMVIQPVWASNFQWSTTATTNPNNTIANWQDGRNKFNLFLSTYLSYSF